jgi:hypothetical protein
MQVQIFDLVSINTHDAHVIIWWTQMLRYKSHTIIHNYNCLSYGSHGCNIDIIIVDKKCRKQYSCVEKNKKE